MDFDSGVNWRDPHGDLLTVVQGMDALHRTWTGVELVVTSGRRRPGADESFHSVPDLDPFRAADVRRWYLDARGLTEYFVLAIWWRYSHLAQVVLEPENLTREQIDLRGGTHRVEPHIHVEIPR